jgi:hypothetical protein
MSMFPASSLWPARDRPPVARLLMALVAAPGMIASTFSFAVFLVAGMTERTPDAVLRVTAESTVALTLLAFAFTLTFGLAGIAVLWRLARRGAIAWALAGGVAGAVAGTLFSGLAMSGVDGAVVLGFAIAGWSLFLLIRRIAGVGKLPKQA